MKIIILLLILACLGGITIIIISLPHYTAQHLLRYSMLYSTCKQNKHYSPIH